MNSRLIMPVPEARRSLGDIGKTTFYRLVKDGRLKVVKIGQRTFVAAAEVERFVNELSAGSPDEDA